MKIVILGGSRGLGKTIADQFKEDQHDVLCWSRTSSEKMDFTKVEDWTRIVQRLAEERPERIIYSAGGGPFGFFGDKKFQDHQWAFRLNFEFPAFLLHQILNQPLQWTLLQQIVFIGSAVAENRPDPQASSYAAAKHALKGLITSIQAEGRSPFDIRLYSPGYMDTSMLPKNAWPRQSGGTLRSPLETAQNLIAWLENRQPASKHQVFE